MTAHGDNCDRERRVLREQEQANLELRAKAAELTGADPDADPAELLRFVQEQVNQRHNELYGVDPDAGEVKREQARWQRRWQRQSDLRRAGRHREADRHYEAIRARLQLGAAVIRLTPTAPATRSRGAGAPAGRRRAAATTGGSSRGDPDAGAQGEPALDLYCWPEDGARSLAIRLGVLIGAGLDADRVLVTAAPELIDLAAEVVDLAVELMRGYGHQVQLDRQAGGFVVSIVRAGR